VGGVVAGGGVVGGDAVMFVLHLSVDDPEECKEEDPGL